MRQSLLAPILVLLFASCSRPNESISPTAQKQTSRDEAKVAELERKVAEFERQQEALEEQYKRQVLARHPQWTVEMRERQLSLLLVKWDASNRTSEEETVRLMNQFGSRVWHCELVEDDFRDMHRAKTSQWRIDDQMKEVRKAIGRLKGEYSPW